MNYFPDKSAVEKQRFSQILEEVFDHLCDVLRVHFKMGELINPEHAVGSGHVVIRFKVGSERWIFRSPLYSRDQLKRTLMAYRNLEGINLMPEKLYQDGKSLIEKHVEGHPLSTAASDGAIVDLARKLGRMHAIPATGYGLLDFDRQGMCADAATYFSKVPAISVDRSDGDLSESHELMLNAAVERATTLPTDLLGSDVVLGHGDLWRRNIVASPSEIRVIDWDRIGAYPPENDLIFMADADLTMAQQALFLHHYGRPVNHSLLSWFNLRRTLMNKRLRLEKKIERIQQLELV